MSPDAFPGIDMAEDEALSVSFHRKTAKWWAVLGRPGATQRVVGMGCTPVAALNDMINLSGAAMEKRTA